MAIRTEPKPSRLERQRALMGVKGDTISAAPRPTSTGDHRQIDLASIKLDQSAQPRESLNTDKTAEYADAMKAGDKFPALVVFEDATGIWLADGFHRHYAAQQAGIKSMSCRVLPGGLRDAILYSVGANATHGVPRSDEDKRRAVLRLLNDAEWVQWSDREIARRCRVSDKTVAKLRPKPSADDPQIERKVERGGTVFTQKVAKAVGAKNAQAEPATLKAVDSSASGPETVETPATTSMCTDEAVGTKEVTPETLETSAVETCTDPEDEREGINPFDDIVARWCALSIEDREAFVAYLRVSGVINQPETAPDGHSAATETPLDSRSRTGRRNGGVGRYGAGAPAEVSPNPGHTISPSDGDAIVAVKSKARLANAAGVEPPPSVSFTNPRCLQPDTCHFVHTRDDCFDCSLAWSKRPKEEQIRLWADANGAAAESEAA